MNQYNLIVILNIVELLSLVVFLKLYVSHRDKRESLIFDPLVFFILGSSFVYIVVPLLMNIFDWSWHNLSLSEESYFKAHLYVYAYIVLVILSYLSIMSKFQKRTKYSSDYLKYTFYRLSKKQYYALVFFFLIPILLDTYYLLAYIFSFDYAYYIKNRIILRKGMGLIVLVSYMGTIIVPIFFANLLIRIKSTSRIRFLKALIIFFIFMVIPLLIAYSLMSNRLTALILLVVLFMIYIVVLEKKFTLIFYLKFIFGSIMAFLFFVFLGYLRSVQGDFSQIKINQFVEVITSHSERAIVANFGNFEHLVWLFDNNKQWELLYGSTFIAALLNVIPRFLWEDKLLGGGPNLKNFIHPGSYDLSGENITSYTTGIAVEGYMNFGIFGIIILSLFHAGMLILLKKMFYHIRGNIILLSLYLYLIFSVTLLMMFGEFLGIYTRTIVVTLPYVLFYFLTKNTNRRI